MAELRDLRLSTYIAAYSIRRHVLACHRLRRARPRAPRACPTWLTRYAYYNSGFNPPRWYYLQRLCQRYQVLRREVGR